MFGVVPLVITSLEAVRCSRLGTATEEDGLPWAYNRTRQGIMMVSGAMGCLSGPCRRDLTQAEAGHQLVFQSACFAKCIHPSDPPPSLPDQRKRHVLRALPRCRHLHRVNGAKSPSWPSAVGLSIKVIGMQPTSAIIPYETLRSDPLIARGHPHCRLGIVPARTHAGPAADPGLCASVGPGKHVPNGHVKTRKWPCRSPGGGC